MPNGNFVQSRHSRQGCYRFVPFTPSPLVGEGWGEGGCPVPALPSWGQSFIV